MIIKEILQKNGFHFNKGYGQNFLTDENLLSSIVSKSGAKDCDTVIEIGVGAGTLTRAIAKQVKNVIGYEIDLKLKPVLKESLFGVDNAEIIFKDVMRLSMQEIEEKAGGDYYLIANLPYYITTPVIMRFFNEAEHCKGITVMVQEEVAKRLCAKENTADYGAITVAVDAFSDAEIIERVNRNMFYPVPNVDSAVVKMTFRSKYGIEDKKAFRETVKSGFSSRRKTLVNNLMQSFKIPREKAEDILRELGIDVMARGETLSTENFVRLSNHLTKNGIIC